MRDLIDREAVLNCFHSWVDKYGDVYTPDEMPEYQAIEALPAVPVREVKRGHKMVSASEEGTAFYVCSECGSAIDFWFDFCPFCGTELREDA